MPLITLCSWQGEQNLGRLLPITAPPFQAMAVAGGGDPLHPSQGEGQPPSHRVCFFHMWIETGAALGSY